jgi:indole-3-glycerol phosphate synthase
VTSGSAPARAGSGESRASTILETIVESTRAEVLERKLKAGVEAEVEGSARRAPGRLRDALSAPGIGVIAEIKRRSPSAGQLRAAVDVREIASAYEQGGACALSVLTEGPHFGGSLEDLRAARAACELPILRKDFIVDPFQLREAVAADADAVLLIVAALPAEQLADLRAQAASVGLDALVEVHDERELAAAVEIGAEIVGVNNRDLHDFSVDVERTFKLLDQMPDGVTVVSESGIDSPEQLRRLQEAGVDAVLVGEALMRAADPRTALEALRGG